MKIVVLYNPVSGAGTARRMGRQVAERLQEAGHDVTRVPTQREDPSDWLDPQLESAAVVIVVGGDGAVRLAAAAAARTETALYHFPSGTENLFAREFGADRCLSRLVASLERFETTEIDLAVANDESFVLMVSIGFDAEVVHDLAATRGKRISHLTYARPMLRQLLRWRATPMRVEVDGRTVVDQRAGIVVVGNSRQYATRLNPAWKADMTDGRLDVVFHPINSLAALLRMVIVHAMGRQSKVTSAVYERGTSVRIECERPVRYQLDGDPPSHAHRSADNGQYVEAIDISLSKLKLRVVIPQA